MGGVERDTQLVPKLLQQVVRCRWTGSNWGELFNAAMDLARQATEEELAADPWRLVRLDRPASRELPDDYEGLPDLLAWAGVFLSDKFKWMSNNMRNASELWETKTTVYMGSRRCSCPPP